MKSGILRLFIFPCAVYCAKVGLNESSLRERLIKETMKDQLPKTMITTCDKNHSHLVNPSFKRIALLSPAVTTTKNSEKGRSDEFNQCW